MIKASKLCVPVIAASVLLVACGGASESTVDQAGEVASSTGDAATELASDAAEVAAEGTEAATDAVTDTASAVADAASEAIDPAAWQDIGANWEENVASVQEAFPDLSMDEITGTAGNPDNLVSLVEQKYEITREEAQSRVSEWVNSL
jgi:uncharacterized protein YjbJ (UPF0337 family)